MAGDISFVDRATGNVVSQFTLHRARLTVESTPYFSFSVTIFGAVVSVNPDGADSVLVTFTSGTTFRFSYNGSMTSGTDVITLSEGGVSDAKYVDGTLWILAGETGQLIRVDPVKKDVTARIVTAPGARYLVHDGRRVWVSVKDRLMQFNAFDGSKVGEVALGVFASALAFDGVTIFAADRVSSTIKTF